MICAVTLDEASSFYPISFILRSAHLSSRAHDGAGASWAHHPRRFPLPPRQAGSGIYPLSRRERAGRTGAFDRTAANDYAAAPSITFSRRQLMVATAAFTGGPRPPSKGPQTLLYGGDQSMPVTYDKRGQVGVITLSRPEARNAWGPDFTEGIAESLAAMEDDDDIRCAVLTGDERGGAFSAGANLKNPQTHTLNSSAEFIKSLPKRRDRQFEMMSNFPKPLIGAVNGYAIGVGCIVTFCCDLLVASERAEWRLPQVALGILPAYGGAVRLARLGG